MSNILELVELYLAQAIDGKSSMSEETIKEFTERCEKSLRRSFNDHEEKNDASLRASNVGSPLCKQQLAHSGATKDEAWNGPYHAMQMLLGDLIEHACIAVLRSAGVNVETVDEPVELDVEGARIKGTYDIKIDGKIYDIKSASPYQFKYKFNAHNAFQKMREEDPFGYMLQGYFYAEADKSDFGGWIAVDKSTGKMTVVETPLVDAAYRKEALTKLRSNVKAILTKAPFKRQFQAEDEKFGKSLTGNKILSTTCSYCPYKSTCWAKEGLTHTATTKSKAVSPKKVWYVGEFK